MRLIYMDKAAAPFSIQNYLLLLVLAVSFPLVAGVVLGIYFDRQQTITNTKTSLRTLASTLSDKTGDRINETRLSLERLATRPLIQQLDPRHCDPLLKDMLILNPDYINVGYLDMTGQLICSTMPIPEGNPVSFEKSPWFQQVLKDKKFSISSPFMGPLSHKLVSVLSTPIWNSHHQMIGAIHVSLGQHFFDPNIPIQLLPERSHYGYFSPDGILIWRNVDENKTIGKRPKAQAARNIVAIRDGEFESMAADGVTRYYAVLPMPATGWIAWVGVPATSIYAKARQRALISSTIASCTIMLLLLLVIYISRKMTVPIAELEKVARAVRDGDLNIRANEHGPRDITAVAREFNNMIEAQQHNIAQLRIAATAFESQESMMITDAAGVILKINGAFSASLGYSADEIVGKTPSMLKSDRHDAAFYRAMWESINRNGSWQGEIWDKRKNGEVFPKWLTISAVKDEKGVVTHYVGTHLDITTRKLAEEKINELAFYDQLTGLPNRTLLFDRLKQAMTASARSESHCALLLIDLDNFKTLNDTLGHDVGDLLLKQVADRLRGCLRAEETVARLGGDEFVVILMGLSNIKGEAADQTEIVGDKILTALNQVYPLKGAVCHSTPSIGATLFTGIQVSIDDLLKQADLAMYRAKETGRNTLRFFDPVMQTCVVRRAELEAGLRDAVQKEQFLLHYQAQVTDAGRVTGAEVLVRWQHPERGMVSPAEFIPLAEDTGLILPLGSWVLETACAQLAVWANQPEMCELTLAVNVSAHQFKQPDFVHQVLSILKKTEANPHRLKLELTESLLVDNVQGVIEKMFALKAKGVGFSLDDFGTGYSSLSYLKRLPLDQLKIDQSFVRDVLIDPNDAAIARTIVALAASLGLGVIAEGVETEAQREFLAGVGCHSYQGYFFSRPLSIHGFEAYVRKT